MHKYILNIVTLLAAISFSNAARSYDGRGSDDCSSLRENLLDAQRSLQEAKSQYRSAVEGRNAMRRQNEQIANMARRAGQNASFNFLSSYNATMSDADDSMVYMAENDLEQAELSYRTNGCTSGGRTNYNHNYNYNR